MRACVYASSTRGRKKKSYDSKTKNDRPREVLILTFIILLPLHLDGHKSSQVTSSQTQSITVFIKKC